jgi:MerR family mercuric resistance operon transcriptional regulator
MRQRARASLATGAGTRRRSVDQPIAIPEERNCPGDEIGLIRGKPGEVGDPGADDPEGKESKGQDAARRCCERAEQATCRYQTLPLPVIGNVISFTDYHGLVHASCSHYRIKDNFMRTITSSRAENVSIGELSKQCGVNIETIRYYERIKMLPEPRRTAKGRRMYGPAEKRILAFVRRSRDLGFTLEEIRALLALGGPERAACADVHRIASAHLANVRSKLSDLAKLEAILAETVAQCSDNATADCPVLDILDVARQSD